MTLGLLLQTAPEEDLGIGFTIFAIVWVIILITSFAVTILKGKYWFALIGVFHPALLVRGRNTLGETTILVGEAVL